MNFSEPIILTTHQVRLEPLTLSHFDDLAEIAVQQIDLLKYSPSPFGSIEAIQQYIDHAIKDRSHQKRYPFAIIHLHNQKCIGSTSYMSFSMSDRRVEIGSTWMDKSLHGSGLNAHCKYLLLDYAFGVLGMCRVELKTDARNAQSRRAIEKIGGIYEGKLRSHTVLSDGHRRDTVYYSILDDEWEASALRASFTKI
ncbi:MAG: GNAT family protein [Saprospiraceae bacterium]